VSVSHYERRKRRPVNPPPREPDSVVHLDDVTHERLRRHCEQQRLQMRSFVSGLILGAVRP
jgi:hypothetical protein